MRSRLEQIRKARRLSRLDLATLADLTESTIIRAERSTPPPVQARNLEKIARALNVPVTDLLVPATESEQAGTVGVIAASERDVLFIQDLAHELRTTVRRLRALMKREPWKLPEPLPALDKRTRWSRVAVERWLELIEPDRKRRQLAAR